MRNCRVRLTFLTTETHSEGLSESDVTSVRQRSYHETVRASQKFVLVHKVDIGDAHEALKKWMNTVEMRTRTRIRT